MHIHISLPFSLRYFHRHPFLFMMIQSPVSTRAIQPTPFPDLSSRLWTADKVGVGNELHLVPERNYWPRLNVTGEIIISQKGLTSRNIASRTSSSVRNYRRDNIGNIKPRLVATGGARPFFFISGCRR